MRVFQNYHRHSCYTNPKIPDSTAKNKDYAIRAKELGHGIISSVEHGWQGKYIEAFELAEEHNLRFVFGTEAYWVKNRFTQDRTNAHICILARNENGRQAINDILSEANLTGIYYQARLDLPLILSLDKNDVIVTSACVAFWQYSDIGKIVKQLHEHFQESFFLEVQYHNTDFQKEINTKILELSNELGIQLIMGCDSHYIYDSDSWERDDFIKSKGIEYPDEEGWYMDYPDGDTAYQRFVEQGVLSEEQINSAMDNTNVFLTVEKYDNPCFDKEIKMPTLYPNLTQEQKDRIFLELISEKWEQEKGKIPVEKHALYYEEIAKELRTIINTKFADYFLLDYWLVKKGIEKGGVITPSARGSGASSYVNKLIGLTKVDRISAEVKMYFERFMSETRIIETKGLPDIDLNFANVAPFVEAQEELLGKNHVAPMLSYGTMQPKAAWKMYAKSQNVNFDIAQAVSDQIFKYEMALKCANSEDEKEDINVDDFIDDEYKDVFESSKSYLGVISDYKISPCSYLLYQGNIRKEIGLIQIKEHLCCVMDKDWAENYHFLKNDLLKVSVVEVIDNTFKKIGIPMLEIDELLAKCPSDDPVWDVYKNGWTMGINQVEQNSTRGRVVKYKPKNISELCAFVAAVRPGFKSMYKTFESREDFSYGIKTLDDLIKTPQFPQSFIMYQEIQMAVLNYAGVPMTECYDIIKNISKKRVDKVFKYKQFFQEGFKKVMIEKEGKNEEEADVLADNIWQIIEDSARYSFNACISKDTKLNRASSRNNVFSPTVEEMFLIRNDKEYAIRTGHKPLHDKYKRYGYGNALSMCEDGRIRKNNIINIFQSGIRKTYKITTSSGSFISCTSNHKFPTPSGEKTASQLFVGDKVFIKGEYEVNRDKHTFTNGNFESNIPQKGQMGFQRKEDGASVIYDTYRKSKVDSLCSCEICGKEIDDNFEMHHKDGDSTNNCIENYCWVCNSCHKKEHYKMNRVKVYEKGIPTKIDAIASIEENGEEMVYDIEMAAPAHNFITDSGFVTSNSHAYCTAIDSLYGAYLKSNYPVQFYTCFLQMLEAGSEKVRMSKAKTEAENAYNIYFPPMKFRQDNREIRGYPETNQIVNSLQSIKGFSRSIAESLYNIKDIKFDDFVDLLVYLEENKIMSTKIRDLIGLQYFSEFGGNKKLITIFDLFKKSPNKYSKTLADKTKQMRITNLKLIFGELLDENLPFEEQIETDLELTGNIQTTYDISKRYSYVLEVDIKYAPRLNLYCLANGKTSSVKVRRKVWGKNKLAVGDVVYCDKFTLEPTKKMNEFGQFVPDGTNTWWLDKYTKKSLPNVAIKL